MRNYFDAAPFLAALALAVCLLCGAGAETPSMEVSEGDPRLSRRGAVTLFDGRPLTGRVISAAGVTPFVDGVREGFEVVWFPNGAISDRRSWRHGRMHGVNRGWWPDGSPRYLTCNRDGVPDGIRMEWFRRPAGHLSARFHYVNGKEVGLQQMWRLNGTLQANYLAIDGERFGLVGTKECE